MDGGCIRETIVKAIPIKSELYLNSESQTYKVIAIPISESYTYK